MTIPVKMDDWTGRRVRLLRDIETQGDVRFLKGDILVVEGHWRGRLTLLDPTCPNTYGAGRRSVSRVNLGLVEVVE